MRLSLFGRCFSVTCPDPRFIQFALASCYAVHINAIVNISKVYMERKNMQLELIRFRKNIAFIHVYFFELRNSTRLTCLRLDKLDSRYNISLFDSAQSLYR